jgi:hypothetical protein
MDRFAEARRAGDQHYDEDSVKAASRRANVEAFLDFDFAQDKEPRHVG